MSATTNDTSVPLERFLEDPQVVSLFAGGASTLVPRELSAKEEFDRQKCHTVSKGTCTRRDKSLIETLTFPRTDEICYKHLPGTEWS
jgi:hypothetical protein